MIVPMKKIFLVVLDAEKKAALKKLSLELICSNCSAQR